MATTRPHDPPTLESKRKISTGYDLGSITDGVANLFNQYSTVQLVNGSQKVLLVRGDANSPATPTETHTGGVLNIASTSKGLSDAKAAQAFVKSKGFWANLPTAAKVGIIAGGSALIVGGGIFLYLK